MTQPAPDPGKKKSTLQMDLLDLPGLRQLRGGSGKVWANARALGLANHALRREAKALLFAELAEAARQGVPLDVAASLAAGHDVDCLVATGEELTIKGQVQAGDITPVLITLAFILMPFIAIPAYIILSGRFGSPAGTARSIAGRLRAELLRGLPLSAAMMNCRVDFDTAEIEIVRAAEQSGNVPAVLKTLAEYQIVERHLQQQSGSLGYPIMLACIGASITTFIYSMIVPKFVDIFSQLGLELPFLTQLMIDLLNLLMYKLPPLMLLVGVPVLAVLLLRGLLNGTVLGFALAVPLVAATVGWAVYSLALFAFDLRPGLGLTFRQERGAAATAAGIAVLLSIAALPRILSVLNAVLLGIESMLRSLFSFIPGVGTLARAQAESLWLAALSARAAGRVRGSGSCRERRPRFAAGGCGEPPKPQPR